jgi:hypothetical protein
MLGFAVILGSLAAGLYFIVRDQGRTHLTAWALTLRVTLSIAFFLLLWLAHGLGWIHPHGLIP